MLKRVSDHIIYGNILIAVCAATMMWQTYMLLKLPLSGLYLLLGFGATLFTYNLDRLVGWKGIAASSSSERHRWIVRHKKTMYALCISGFIISLWCTFYLPWSMVLFMGHLGAVSVLYAIPFLPGLEKKKSLRSVRGLKIFLITYVWTGATVWLPALDGGLAIGDRAVVLQALQRALFIFAITLPFDIRDYRGDRQTRVATIPGMIGIRRSRLLAVACMLLFIVLCYVQFGWGNAFFGLLASGLFTIYLVAVLGSRHHEYFFTGMLDGTMLVQPLLVYLFITG